MYFVQNFIFTDFYQIMELPLDVTILGAEFRILFRRKILQFKL